MSHVGSVSAQYLMWETSAHDAGGKFETWFALERVQNGLTKVRLAIRPKKDFAMIPNTRRR